MGGNATRLFHAGFRIIKERGHYESAQSGYPKEGHKEGDLAGAITVTVPQISDNKMVNRSKRPMVTG